MDFHPDRTGVPYHRLVRSDNGIYTVLQGRIHYLFHLLHFVVEDDGIQGEVGAYPLFFANAGDPDEIAKRKVYGRTGTHIEHANTEIHRICPGPDCCLE